MVAILLHHGLLPDAVPLRQAILYRESFRALAKRDAEWLAWGLLGGDS